MLDFWAKHNITCDIELIPIQKINEADDQLMKNDVKYRFVIDMTSLEKPGKKTSPYCAVEKYFEHRVKGFQQQIDPQPGEKYAMAQ